MNFDLIFNVILAGYDLLKPNGVMLFTGLRHIHTLSFTIWFCSQGIIMIIYQTKKRGMILIVIHMNFAFVLVCIWIVSH
jgi:hypothetical protein